MSVTTNMNLTLPVVSVTLGPDYATQNNVAFETVDAHDHTSGKGTKVPTAGLNINANLNFNSRKAYNLTSVQLVNQSPALSGAANALSVSTTSGDLYYTNGSGTSVQITSGGALVSAPGAVDTMPLTTTSASLGINAGDTFVVVLVNSTGGSRTITLPLVSAVNTGRIYIIKDADGASNANPMTVDTVGGDTIDGAATATIDSNYGSIMVIGNGATSWSII